MVQAYEIAVMVLCLMGSALCSGLTLGLLSLDLTELRVYIDCGTPQQQKYAKKIYPIRKRGNQLLVSLLVGNTAVNSALAIVSAELFSGIYGFLVSTVSILYLGEIIPQAVFHRHGLLVGYYTVYLVITLMVITCPIAWPTAKILGWILGEETELRYTRKQIQSLVNIHGSAGTAAEFSRDETAVLGSAMEFWEKTVREVMTPLDKVFMLDATTPLNFETLSLIFYSGHSRVPVFRNTRHNVIGVVFAKDLILLDPDDGIQAQTIMALFNREVPDVPSDLTLGDLLKEFKTGRGHLAIVKDLISSEGKDPFYETIGVVTLEDVIEELIGSEIVDETDVFEDNESQTRVKRKRRFDPTVLNMLDSQRSNRSTLSSNELDVVTSYLTRHLDEFSTNHVTEPVARRMLKHCEVISYTEDLQLAQVLAIPADLEARYLHLANGNDVKKRNTPFKIFVRGEPSSFAVLVLQGRMKLTIGEESFSSEVGPWTLIGRPSLTNPNYIADFTAETLELPCRFVRIERHNYMNARKLTQQARNLRFGPSSPDYDDDNDDDGFMAPPSMRKNQNEFIARTPEQDGENNLNSETQNDGCR
uniref:CNNM transmembrane domain-containing protein n=1 Tax=Compsopogon caeruleus TaxID=31354 RepID=A0A7S1XBV1_9RHOD|mmetsp:Transcript_12635/g.25623  ORF Transcript_12635/g.25623 Transcript_12635/m.25623 type:complete len:588 (+) Transcript_12635:460-2223(+)|eukprot:CAMPEP_0184678460 /NCGR_PEP_ID=MMETSP0312-20130426/1204_1 /TAXON_ID=31354 /ORGANISM="Compsopogon coeruleus, Strain SAG 36.94" /LENGTH=587 /DNA_ID=CAMNT_0027127217 /DNA_START=450 /DNA_END=2213 /DNA_ORIENTATION=+